MRSFSEFVNYKLYEADAPPPAGAGGSPPPAGGGMPPPSMGGGAGGGINGEDGYVDLITYTPYSIVGKAGTQTGGGAAPSGVNTVGGAGSYNQGGTHQNAFREAVVKTLRDFYKKEYDVVDIRSSICAAILGGSVILSIRS